MAAEMKYSNAVIILGILIIVPPWTVNVCLYCYSISDWKKIQAKLEKIHPVFLLNEKRKQKLCRRKLETAIYM